MSTRSVKVTKSADKEFLSLPKEVRRKFLVIFDLVEHEDYVEKSKFKKLKGYNLYELRVKHDTNIYRAIGGMIKPDIVVVVFFVKKSQKIPTKILNKAINRFKSLQNEK